MISRIANVIIWFLLDPRTRQSNAYFISYVLINCPINSYCNIQSYTERTFSNTIINATYSSSASYQGISIYGSKLIPDTADVNLACNGYNGATNGHLVVCCNKNRICLNAISNGLYESYLYPLIYFPPTSNGNEKLAVNQWIDFDINYKGTFNQSYHDKMFSEYSYNTYGDISDIDGYFDNIAIEEIHNDDKQRDMVIIMFLSTLCFVIWRAMRIEIWKTNIKVKWIKICNHKVYIKQLSEIPHERNGETVSAKVTDIENYPQSIPTKNHQNKSKGVPLYYNGPVFPKLHHEDDDRNNKVKGRETEKMISDWIEHMQNGVNMDIDVFLQQLEDMMADRNVDGDNCIPVPIQLKDYQL